MLSSTNIPYSRLCKSPFSSLFLINIFINHLILYFIWDIISESVLCEIKYPWNVCFQTCNSSSLSLWSCDSNCLLWSSSICMRVSRRLLCCLSTRASARSSSSCCPRGKPKPEMPSTSCGVAAAASSCFHFSRRYSPCSILHILIYHYHQLCFYNLFYN